MKQVVTGDRLQVDGSAPPSAMVGPPVAPAPREVARPLWSVMIPTFNCAQYLRQTLESVLAQDPGPDRMQIEVVDDCSTKDDPEAVVREVGRGRVAFHRKPANQGATANFNTCIDRSRGHLVHILHGDDYVLPGFYSGFESAFEESASCAAVFARALIVDGSGELLALSDRAPALERGTTDPGTLLAANPLRTPAAAVRRSFYEQNGGFLANLRHVSDWEMWVRTIARGGARMLNAPLACYREFAQNDTARVMRTGDNLRNLADLGALWSAQDLPGFDPSSFELMITSAAEYQWRRFRALGDEEAVRANYSFWRGRCSRGQRIRADVLEGIRPCRAAIKNFISANA